MNVTAIKIRLVFLPLILLGIIFVSVYALLYFLLYIKLKAVPLRLDVVQYWIPIGLGFILMLLFMRSRVHLLKLDKDNGRIRTLYYMVGTAVFCIPTIVGLGLLETATGKLTKLQSINEISLKPVTKFYTVDSYALHKDKIGIESIISYSGKRNEHLNFDIFVAMPFVDKLGDSILSARAFLSIKFHKQISSKISQSNRSDEWKSFWDDSFEQFEENKIVFEYLELMPNTDERDNLLLAAKKSELYHEGSPVIILKAIDTPFEERNGHKLRTMFLSFGIGAVIWFLMILIPGIHIDKAKSFETTSRSVALQQLIGTIEMIKPRNGFTATPILILLNIVVFVVLVFMGYGFVSFHSRDLIAFGAIYGPGIEHGEWWRFLTGMFLHGGFMHLIMNVISLYLAGILLETFIGTKRFILLYFLSGIAAGIISVWWHDKLVVSVGASGAIFGLYGVLLSMIMLKRFDKTLNKTMLIFLACTAGYSLLMGFLSEGIDNSAHLGGLAAGFTLSFLIGFKGDKV